MFVSHIYVEKPIDLEVKMHDTLRTTIHSKDRNFNLLFADLETLNDFAQAIMGLALKGRAEAEKWTG